MKVEYWRIIPTCPSYSASNYGRIRNDKTGRIMRPNHNTNGYLSLTLRVNGEAVMRRVHRLVAEAFLGGPHPGLDVNHIDGDKTNNCVENLEWCTRSENIKHAFANGLKKNPRSTPVYLVETNMLFESARACANYLNADVSSILWALKHSGIYRGWHVEYV